MNFGVLKLEQWTLALCNDIVIYIMAVFDGLVSVVKKLNFVCGFHYIGPLDTEGNHDLGDAK